MTSTGNQTIDTLSKIGTRKETLVQAREREANDLVQAEATQNLNAYKAHLTAINEEADRDHKKVLQERMRAEMSKWDDDQINAVKKQMTAEQRLNLDRHIQADTTANQVADNIRADKQLKINQQNADKNTVKDTSETVSERLRRIKEGNAAGVAALGSLEDSSLDQLEIEADTYNYLGNDSGTYMLRRNTVEQPWYKKDSEEITKVPLPKYKGTQVTLKLMRETINDQLPTIEAVHDELLRRIEAGE